MDLEDALAADMEEYKRDAARLDWLLENNKMLKQLIRVLLLN